MSPDIGGAFPMRFKHPTMFLLVFGILVGTAHGQTLYFAGPSGVLRSSVDGSVRTTLSFALPGENFRDVVPETGIARHWLGQERQMVLDVPGGCELGAGCHLLIRISNHAQKKPCQRSASSR